MVQETQINLFSGEEGMYAANPCFLLINEDPELECYKFWDTFNKTKEILSREDKYWQRILKTPRQLGFNCPPDKEGLTEKLKELFKNEGNKKLENENYKVIDGLSKKRKLMCFMQLMRAYKVKFIA